jgi:hypothetical protein
MLLVSVNTIPHVVRELYSLYRLSAMLFTSQSVIGGFKMEDQGMRVIKEDCPVIGAPLIPRHRRSRAELGLLLPRTHHTAKIMRRAH